MLCFCGRWKAGGELGGMVCIRSTGIELRPVVRRGMAVRAGDGHPARRYEGVEYLFSKTILFPKIR